MTKVFRIYIKYTLNLLVTGSLKGQHNRELYLSFVYKGQSKFFCIYEQLNHESRFGFLKKDRAGDTILLIGSLFGQNPNPLINISLQVIL
jgi:hypothetical protein